MRDAVAIPRTEDSVFSQLEAVKERLAADLTAACAKLELPGEVTKSALHQQDPWAQWTATLVSPLNDRGRLQRRLALRVRARGVPFHRYPVLYRVELFDNDFHGVADDVLRCDAGDVERVLDALGRGRVPTRRLARRLGLPHLRPGLLGVPFLFGVVNKIDILRGRYDVWVGALAALGCFMAGAAMVEVDGVLAAPLFVLALVALLWWVLLLRRNHWVVSSGKPASEPRTLERWDEWQVLLPGIGRSAGVLRQELLGEITKASPPEARAVLEDEWNWGLDGKEVRARLVVTYRRALVFVHVNSYGDDLYVGWNAHVNRGQWSEVEVARGVLRGTSELVALRTVQHAVQPVTEFDLQDATSVGEFVHRHAAKLVRRLLKEHEIDVELDFKVVRERRVAGEGAAPGGGGGLFARFRRVE